MTTYRKDPPQQLVVVMIAVHCCSDIGTLLVLGFTPIRSLLPLHVALVLVHIVQYRLQGGSDEAGADIISWPSYLQTNKGV